MTTRNNASILCVGGEIMIDIKMIEIEMKQQDVTNEQMADALGVNLSTWYRKKKNPETINIGDIENIANKLKLSKAKAIEIFL